MASRIKIRVNSSESDGTAAEFMSEGADLVLFEVVDGRLQVAVLGADNRWRHSTGA